MGARRDDVNGVHSGRNDRSGKRPRVNQPDQSEEQWSFDVILGPENATEEPELRVGFRISRRNFPVIESAAYEVLAHYLDLDNLVARTLHRRVTVVDGDYVVVEASPDETGTAKIVWHREHNQKVSRLAYSPVTTSTS